MEINISDLQNFIKHHGKNILPENGIIGTSMIVFEFLTEDGKAGYSILRPPGTTLDECMSTLARSTDVLLRQYIDEVQDEFPEDSQ